MPQKFDPRDINASCAASSINGTCSDRMKAIADVLILAQLRHRSLLQSLDYDFWHLQDAVRPVSIIQNPYEFWEMEGRQKEVT